MGNLSEPKEKLLVIDGQHRLAALHFFAGRNPNLADHVEVPCILFDGKSADFATEMFVIINSTHTRINKSHLVDLYEKISWESPDKKCAAKIVNLLYDEDDSPLRYKINRLGGRSRQEKWVLQSELYNEIHKVIEAHRKFWADRYHLRPQRIYEPLRDYFKGVREVMGEVWGKNDKFMFTRDVTLKALVRVFGTLVQDRKTIEAWEGEKTPKVFSRTLQPWKGLERDFRAEGFYERFPAKGQVERVRRIHERLLESLPVKKVPRQA
jgi:DGQHR domain-containing protein